MSVLQSCSRPTELRLCFGAFVSMFVSFTPAVFVCFLTVGCGESLAGNGNLPVSGSADPTLLPVASGQVEDLGAYGGRTLAAGQTYTDPATGVLVVKLTDANTPIAGNGRGVPDYSEGGPLISQPWDSAGGIFYTLYVMVDVSPSTHYFVDVKYPDMTLHNWRQLSVMENVDLMWAWSLNPATPRVGYGLGMPSRNVLRKFDTDAMSELTGGGFPKTIPEQSGWLQVSVNDEWFAMRSRSTPTVFAYGPGTNTLHTWVFNSLDEPHLDRDGGYVYVIKTEVTAGCYSDANLNIIRLMRTSDGQEVQPAPNVSAWPAACSNELYNTHIAGLRGRMVTENPHASLGTQGRWEYAYDPVADQVIFHHSEDDAFDSSGHRAGQWVFNNGNGGSSQWYVTSNFGGSAALRDAVGFVSIDPSMPVRLLAHHYTVGAKTNYFAQPHATVSPDGKLVMWGSTMGVDGGRLDAFLARVPAR